jgi:hypothetical protein
MTSSAQGLRPPRHSGARKGPSSAANPRLGPARSRSTTRGERRTRRRSLGGVRRERTASTRAPLPDLFPPRVRTAREPRERGCARELSRARGAVARGRERKCGVRPFFPPRHPLCARNAGAAPGLFRAAPRPESLQMPPRSPREKGVAPRQCRRGHSKAAGSPSFLSLSLPPSQVLAFSCRCCCVCVCCWSMLVVVVVVGCGPGERAAVRWRLPRGVARPYRRRYVQSRGKAHQTPAPAPAPARTQDPPQPPPPPPPPSVAASPSCRPVAYESVEAMMALM